MNQLNDLVIFVYTKLSELDTNGYLSVDDILWKGYHELQGYCEPSENKCDLLTQPIILNYQGFKIKISQDVRADISAFVHTPQFTYKLKNKGIRIAPTWTNRWVRVGFCLISAKKMSEDQIVAIKTGIQMTNQRIGLPNWYKPNYCTESLADELAKHHTLKS